jgi:prepilin-type processing-associated H-X9-DG protein
VVEQSRHNYIASIGVGPFPGTLAAAWAPKPNAPFSVNSAVRFSDVSDGLSNTALMSELITVAGDDPRGVSPSVHALYRHDELPNTSRPDVLFADFQNPGTGRTDVNCVSVPHAPCQGTITTNNPGLQLYIFISLHISARSKHPGGVNLLLGDGSVRFVSNSVGLATWQSLGTTQGGEVLGSDW